MFAVRDLSVLSAMSRQDHSRERTSIVLRKYQYGHGPLLTKSMKPAAWTSTDTADGTSFTRIPYR
jgi:hypothetical protein